MASLLNGDGDRADQCDLAKILVHPHPTAVPKLNNLFRCSCSISVVCVLRSLVERWVNYFMAAGCVASILMRWPPLRACCSLSGVCALFETLGDSWSRRLTVVGDSQVRLSWSSWVPWSPSAIGCKGQTEFKVRAKIENVWESLWTFINLPTLVSALTEFNCSAVLNCFISFSGSYGS